MRVTKSTGILQALAAARDGLRTSDVAIAIGEADSVSQVGVLLSYAAGHGRIVKVSGGQRGNEALWEITDHGREFLRELLAESRSELRAESRDASPAAEPRISAPVRRVPAAPSAPRFGGKLPPIGRGVPVPGIKRPPNKYAAAAAAMKCGDRIVFARQTEACAMATQLRKAGRTAALRQLDDGRYGVWRVR